MNAQIDEDVVKIKRENINFAPASDYGIAPPRASKSIQLSNYQQILSRSSPRVKISRTLPGSLKNIWIKLYDLYGFSVENIDFAQGKLLNTYLESQSAAEATAAVLGS